MNAKETIKQSMDLALNVLGGLLDDLSDDELLIRPAGKANHIAWQLGHLISSERQLTEGVCPGSCPELPEGFADAHGKEQAASDSREGFLTKREYVDLYQKQRAATLKALDALPDADLDNEATEFIRQICPNVAGVFALQSAHQMWHIGQLTVLRRQLGKPVVF